MHADSTSFFLREIPRRSRHSAPAAGTSGHVWNSVAGAPYDLPEWRRSHGLIASDEQAARESEADLLSFMIR